MIKFFRRIRYDLMEKNKIGKPGLSIGRYLKYAISEIFLVVIGILIAIQINNWNEGLKAIKSENELITSLKEEIIVNIEQLELVKKNNDLLANDGKNIIQKLNQGGDTISSAELTRAFNYFPSIVKSPVLDGVVASNSKLFVKNKRLVTDLRILKDSYEDIIKQEFYLDEFWNAKVVDFFVSCGFAFEENLDNETIITMKDIELGGYSKKQFIALIKINEDLHKYWEDRRKKAFEKSNDMLSLLKV